MANQVQIPFENRRAAGRVLAHMLTGYADHPGVIVLGLPRGGVPVAAEVAEALHAPLDILLVRKLGAPGHEELAMGAIASDGARILNHEVVRDLRITPRQIAAVEAREEAEMARRAVSYRDDRPFPDLRGRIVLLVDDGLATGSTMRAAAEAVRQKRPAWVVAAAPVAAPQVRDMLTRIVDEVVIAVLPDPFYAVGLWYREFEPTSDEEVRAALRQAWTRTDLAAPPPPRETDSAPGETR
ncbi:MAG: phosphoribosyltransferase [Thermomicrobiales bacterium]|nr:phosphoribosyltransferase [Thermomicrobiales bacterium]